MEVMPRVLTNGKIKLGAYRFSDRKKIALCVEEGNSIIVCGYFSSTENADFFMDKIAECIGQSGEKAESHELHPIFKEE